MTMTLTQFIGRMTAAHMALKVAESRALTRAAKIVEKEAKAEIGTYQGAIGNIPAWAPLAEATKADRVRLGYPADEPLLRTGELRDSIGHAVRDRVAIVGSNNDKAVWQELGTDRIPPRSFLAGAAMRKLPEVGRAMAGEVVANFIGPNNAARLLKP